MSPIISPETYTIELAPCIRLRSRLSLHVELVMGNTRVHEALCMDTLSCLKVLIMLFKGLQDTAYTTEIAMQSDMYCFTLNMNCEAGLQSLLAARNA